MAWARAAGAGLRPHLRRSLPRRSLLRPLCASSGGRGGGDALEIVGEFARLDHGRTGRTGFPEAVFSEGKTPQQVAEIFERMVARLGDGGDYPAVLATRASPEAYAAVKARGACPDAAYLPESRLILYPPSVADAMRRGEGAAPAGGAGRGDDEAGHVALCAAGTSDLPVCEEAAAVLAACGVRVSRFYDVGVAGVHRLLRVMPQIREADAVIAVAGMEGALPSVLAGLLEAPLVAVPTSVGYGASRDGLTPMHAMLSGCAPGVAVVNIDNGFGAAAMAVKILRIGARRRERRDAAAKATP